MMRDQGDESMDEMVETMGLDLIPKNAENPGAMRALVAELQTALDDWQSQTLPYAGPESAGMKEVDSRTQALLRALGYVNN